VAVAPPRRPLKAFKRTFYTPAASAKDALKGDWEKVGASIADAIAECAPDHGDEKQER